MSVAVVEQVMVLSLYKVLGAILTVLRLGAVFWTVAVAVEVVTIPVLPVAVAVHVMVSPTLLLLLVTVRLCWLPAVTPLICHA